MPGRQMSPIKASMRKDSRRSWLSGLAVTLTTIVAYLAFWRLSPGVTFVVGCAALLGLVVAGWVLGSVSRQSEKEPPPRSGHRE